MKVIISGGFSTAYRKLLPEFESSTGIAVTTLSGASQGKGPETIAAQLGRGLASRSTWRSSRARGLPS
jgi:molybdate transport system substrate-binding protein